MFSASRPVGEGPQWVRILPQLRHNGSLRGYQPRPLTVLQPDCQVHGLGTTGCFDMRLQARAGQKEELAEVMRGLIVKANQTPGLAGVFSTFSADVPQVFVDVDRKRAELYGVSPATIFSALQAHLGPAQNPEVMLWVSFAIAGEFLECSWNERHRKH